MLNELFALQRGLAAAGAEIVPRHADVNDMAKGAAIRVRLDKTGAISSLELIKVSGRDAPWTLRDGNHNGFPGIKTKLLRLSSDAQATSEAAWRSAKSPAERRSCILGLIESYRSALDGVIWPEAGFRQRISERLAQLLPLSANLATASVPETFQRFLRATNRTPPFIAALADAMAIQVRDGDQDWLDPVHDALTNVVVLAVDVADDEATFTRDAGDPRQVEAVSAAIAAHESQASGSKQGVCALTGEMVPLVSGNFPKPILRSLGPTFVFSRNGDIPAMWRHGRFAADSFALSADLATRLYGTGIALTETSRKDKTWRLIPAETGGRSDLLLASLASDPDLPLAGVLAAEEDEAVGWAGVETASESLIRLLDGRLESATPQEHVHLLVLRKVDRGNGKAVFSRQASARSLHAAALRWKAAMLNAPASIRHNIILRDSGKRASCKPPLLPPLSLVPISSRQFTNGGQRQVAVAGIAASEALGLFFAEADRARRAQPILRTLLQRNTGLLPVLAHARRRGDVVLEKFDPTMTLRRDALGAVAWLGALLHAMDSMKENYMHDTAFKLGQLLAAADTVHVGYCASERGGNTPPMLLGNAVFALAGRDPARALGVLCSRWKPYGAWARRPDEPRTPRDDDAKAQESLTIRIRTGRRHARIAAELCRDLEPALAGDLTVDDRFRAELLLGYVAGVPPAERKPDTPPDATASPADTNQGNDA